MWKSRNRISGMLIFKWGIHLKKKEIEKSDFVLPISLIFGYNDL